MVEVLVVQVETVAALVQVVLQHLKFLMLLSFLQQNLLPLALLEVWEQVLLVLVMVLQVLLVVFPLLALN